MKNDKKFKYGDKVKECKVCGRKLPISEFPVCGRITCKPCINRQRREKSAEDRMNNGIEQYLSDDSMHIKRQYKKIDSSRILRKKDSGIDFVAKDERFVKLLYYKDTWISSYSRCVVYEDGKYKLLRGSVDKWTGERKYTLKKEEYVKSTGQYKYRKRDVLASKLVIETFIVNYDMMNNTHIWHLNNDVADGYYKHLYPVTEKQYDKLTELQFTTSEPLTEEDIMQVINAVEYKQDGWNPAYYKRTYEKCGYVGMKIDDYLEPSFLRWRNMVQRCYNRKIHERKPEYKDKNVCEEWLNYANYKIWYDEHYIPSKNNQIDLDKDLLVQGNKIYSPETCVFLIHYQNVMFERKCGDCVSQNEEGQYLVDKKKSEIFDTYEDAFAAVIERRKKKILDTAEKCKGYIPMCAYEAMLRWDVSVA